MSLAMTLARCGSLLLICSLVAGCTGSKDNSEFPEPDPTKPKRTDPARTEADTKFEANKVMFGKVQKAEQVTVYEGLPHPMFETKLFEDEKRQKKTVMLHGYPFYHDRLEISAKEKEKLKASLGDENSFEQWIGEKKCGGFHPDYCVELTVDGAAYQCLICFGCAEIKVYCPDHSLRCDMRGEFSGKAYKQLHELLKQHQKHRPPSNDRKRG